MPLFSPLYCKSSSESRYLTQPFKRQRGPPIHHCMASLSWLLETSDEWRATAGHMLPALLPRAAIVLFQYKKTKPKKQDSLRERHIGLLWLVEEGRWLVQRSMWQEIKLEPSTSIQMGLWEVEKCWQSGKEREQKGRVMARVEQAALSDGGSLSPSGDVSSLQSLHAHQHAKTSRDTLQGWLHCKTSLLVCPQLWERGGRGLEAYKHFLYWPSCQNVCSLLIHPWL